MNALRRQINCRLTFKMASASVLASAASRETTEDAQRDQDDDAERAKPTPALLWPDATYLDRFSLIVSKAAFEGWCRQPSPCCAAASVAGACNAALGVAAGTKGTLTHLEVAALLHGMLADQAEKRHSSVSRLLGVPSFEPALAALREDLAVEGRSLGGRKELGIKGKEALARLRALAERFAPPPAQPEAEAEAGSAAPPTVWSALLEVLEPAKPADAADAEGSPEDDNEDEDEAPLGTSAPSKGGADEFPKKVRREIKTLITKLSGVDQLAPAQAPPSLPLALTTR
jgi:hypothetical protein